MNDCIRSTEILKPPYIVRTCILQNGKGEVLTRLLLSKQWKRFLMQTYENNIPSALTFWTLGVLVLFSWAPSPSGSSTLTCIPFSRPKGWHESSHTSCAEKHQPYGQNIATTCWDRVPRRGSPGQGKARRQCTLDQKRYSLTFCISVTSSLHSRAIPRTPNSCAHNRSHKNKWLICSIFFNSVFTGRWFSCSSSI